MRGSLKIFGLFFHQDIARLKIDLASQVPSEPELNNPQTVGVLFKLPNGQRIERRFRDTDQLKVWDTFDDMLASFWTNSFRFSILTGRLQLHFLSSIVTRLLSTDHKFPKTYFRSQRFDPFTSCGWSTKSWCFVCQWSWCVIIASQTATCLFISNFILKSNHCSQLNSIGQSIFFEQK